MTHVETLTVTRVNGKAVIKTEDDVATFEGDTVAEALAKAGTFLTFVFDTMDRKKPRVSGAFHFETNRFRGMFSGRERVRFPCPAQLRRQTWIAKS